MCHQRKLCRHILAVVVPAEPVVGVGQLGMLRKRQEPQAMPVAIGRAIVIVARRHVWFGETQIEVFLHYGALRVMIRVEVWLGSTSYEQLQRSLVEWRVFGVDCRPRTLERHWQLTRWHLYNRCADERLHTKTHNSIINFQFSSFQYHLCWIVGRTSIANAVLVYKRTSAIVNCKHIEIRACVFEKKIISQIVSFFRFKIRYLSLLRQN